MFTDGTIWSRNIEGSRETRKRELVKTLQLQRGGKLANSGREGKGRRLSLSFLCPAHRVQTCRWRRGRGGSAVFSRTSFLCVGLIGAEWGKESTIQLAVSTKHPSLQNTHTHTLWQRSCTQFPAWESERGRKKKKGNFWRWKAPDNYSLLVSRSDSHEMRHEVVWGEKGTVRKLDWDHPRCSLRTKIKWLELARPVLEHSFPVQLRKKQTKKGISTYGVVSHCSFYWSLSWIMWSQSNQ